MDFAVYIKEAGPFTAPLCVGMLFVIRWLLKDRDRLIMELKVQAADATQLREKRIEDRKEAAIEYRQVADALRSELQTFNTAGKAVLDMATRVAGGG